jgi:hypothetical protein
MESRAFKTAQASLQSGLTKQTLGMAQFEWPAPERFNWALSASP